MQKFNTCFRPLLICVFILSFTMSVSAHPGRTDSNGGHYNRKTGEYHYHNGSSAGRNIGGDSDSYSYSNFVGPTTDYSYNSNNGSTTKNTKEENKLQLPKALVWVIAVTVFICFNFVIPMLLDKKPTKTHTPLNNGSNTANQSEEEKSRLIRESAAQEFYSQQYAKPVKTKYRSTRSKNLLSRIFERIDILPEPLHTIIYIVIIILFFAFCLAVWQLLVILVHSLYSYGN